MKKEIEAFSRGYRVTEDGILLSKTGATIGSVNNTGYLSFEIRSNGGKIRISCHRLQAYQKYGDALYGVGMVVRHKNNNKLDNSWDNILIGTHSQNKMDIPEQQRILHAKLAASYLKKHDYNAIRFFHSKSNSYKQTMEKFSITSKGTLNYILNSK